MALVFADLLVLLRIQVGKLLAIDLMKRDQERERIVNIAAAALGTLASGRITSIGPPAEFRRQGHRLSAPLDFDRDVLARPRQKQGQA